MSQIAILDAGSQYGKLIDGQIRTLGVLSDILPLDISYKKLEKYTGIIISGSPQSVLQNNTTFRNEILLSKIPILGICYGMQIINKYFQGITSNTVERSDGQFTININNNLPIFQGLNDQELVLLTHGDSIIREPSKFVVTATSISAKIIYGFQYNNIYGIQFHPEVNLTLNGSKIFENFLFNICKCHRNYKLEDKYNLALDYIINQSSNKKILTLVSGGIDSTVCSALLYRALGKDRVVAIHVDNGFMRYNESYYVEKALKEIGFELVVIDAKERFYDRLGDETDPEKIRQIVGNTFIEIVEEEIQKMGVNSDYLLAQGTLRPDLIESASKIVSCNASVIKTHHNDTNMVRRLRDEGKIIEPLKDYHKNEVREIGRKLGLLDNLVDRHPFPGPGLSIRIICDEYRENYDKINDKLNIFRERKIDLQLLPIRSVGVQGDNRSYNYVCGITTFLGWDELIKLAKEIPQMVKEICRIVYIFGGKFNKINYTKTYLHLKEIKLIREADRICQNLLDNKSKISQMPIILLPL